MALSLSKKISCLAAMLCLCSGIFAQSNKPTTESASDTRQLATDPKEAEHDPSDYKDPKQFEKFGRRRVVVGAWQINQLKKGALIIRLKTNQKLIDAFRADGKADMAFQKQLEQFAINKNIMFAYRDYLRFCKVYFIYSNSSDTLLHGAKKGIFLDTNLVIDPSIVMNESFYMIAERDYAYNSSIGFLPEDSAKYAIETGNPIKEMAVVIKNKFGAQVKAPFPYCVKEKSSIDAFYDFPITTSERPGGETVIIFPVNKTYLQDLKNQKDRKPVHADQRYVKIAKELTYERVAAAVDQLNDFLNQYYQANPNPDLTRIDPEIKQFLY